MKPIKTKIYNLAAYLLLAPAAAFGATSESENVTQQTLAGESDSDAEQAELEQLNALDTSDFLDGSNITLRSIWYSRVRTAIDTAPNNQNVAGNIRTNVLGLGLDISSGYWRNMLGVDFSLNSNLKVGPTVGQSEILRYDYTNQQESSEAAIGRAALKWKFGSDDNGLKTNVGYTPINVGTIGTSGGLHSHAYRGLDAKYNFHDFEFGYGWADQFRNEWTDQYLDITNAWNQDQAPFQGTTQRIDYIQSAGVRYKFGENKDAYIDVGAGQGKDYRNNQQIAGSYTFDLGEKRTLSFIAYYFQAQYDPELSSISDPSNEWHSSIGANYKQGLWSFFTGYGATHAPDSGELNFRLAPWANADNRNFIQTWGQLDDFVWDGEQVVKLGVNYEIGELIALPGLATGMNYNYGWGLRNKDASGNYIGASKVHEMDAQLTYTVPTGKLKGLGAGVYAAWLRGDTDFYGKPNHNDVKFLVSYSVKLL